MRPYMREKDINIKLKFLKLHFRLIFHCCCAGHLKGKESVRRFSMFEGRTGQENRADHVLIKKRRLMYSYQC